MTDAVQSVMGQLSQDQQIETNVESGEQLTGENTLETDKTGQESLSNTQDDPKIASRFAALSKRERALQLEREKLKQEREEYEAYKTAKENAKNDPLAYLDKSGLKLEDVIYSGLGSRPEPTADEKIKQLQERIERKELEEKEEKAKYKQEQESASISNFKASIDKHIKDNYEKYELINLASASNEVFELMAGVLEQTTKAGKPRYLSIEEAADQIEKYYDQHLDEIFGKSKKLASRYSKIITDQTDNKDQQKPTTTASTTLKNNMAAKPSASFSNSENTPAMLTLEQKKEAALKRSINMLSNNLNR